MHQKTDLLFQEMLVRIWELKLDFYNIRALNQKLAIKLSTLGTLNTVIMV